MGTISDSFLSDFPVYEAIILNCGEQEHVAALRQKAQRLEEMGSRNAGDRVVSSQVAFKLKQVQAQLAAAEEAAACSSHAAHAKDAQKKWMKF